MSNLPTGMITFLLSDIESSTLLWEKYPGEMRQALIHHDKIIEDIVAANAGRVVRPRGEGDSRFVVFEQAELAVKAASKIQQSLTAGFSDYPFALKVRIGLHTGSADLRAGDYYGTAVNRCARIRGLGHGGQTLISEVTAHLVQDVLPVGHRLVDMGSHHLKGLHRPEQVYQLWIPELPNEFPPLMSAGFVLNNLPGTATDFIGRQDEVAAISALFRQGNARLVTLTGPGGAGKTRLCLETAHHLLESFTHGVFFVDLSPLFDPALIASTIARSMGIREGGGRPPLENLLDYLSGKEMLLVLDNFEQIIDNATVVSQILSAAPGVKIMVTSRIALSLRGEREYPVLSLAMPDSSTTYTVPQLMEFEAIKLFVERAQAIRPTFDLTADNAHAVGEICRRLDGLPLAIEIAAARIRILPPQALLKRLDQSLRLLVGGAKDLPTRQQTLRSTIDWSYELLDEREKLLFARLSVFVGGFTLESAEGVCNANGEIDVLGIIETLVRNNLVRPIVSVSDYPRFDMLLTIREYAQDKLEETHELDHVRQKHAEYFGQQAEIDGMQLYSQQSTSWLERVDEDHDNYRAAIAFGVINDSSLGMAVQICLYLFWFWYRYGHFHEGREWSDKVLAAAESADGTHSAMALMPSCLMAMWEGDLEIAAQRGKEATIKFNIRSMALGQALAQLGFGVVLLNQGKDQQAYPHLLTASELYDELGLKWFTATTLIHIANAALGLGEIDRALASLDQAQVIVNQINDPWQLGFCSNNYGEIARVQGEFDKADVYYRQTEEFFREADAAGDQARLVYALAIIAQHKGNYEKAQVLFHESLSDFRKLGNKRGIAECLAGIAGLAVKQGDIAPAVTLYSAAETLITSFSATWWPADRVEFEQALTTMKASLDPAEFEKLWDAGQLMSMEQALFFVERDFSN